MNNSSSKRSRAVFQLDAASALTLNTITLMTFMAASSAPTPLYRLYQQLWQFSPVTLTLIFATYAFTLLGSLLIIGSLSDYIGRRPVIIAAISLQIISMSFFLFASDVSMLFIARGLQGIATGLAVSAIGAAILDFSKLHGSLINSIAPMIGMAVGIFLTCSILQFSAHPLQLVFEFLCFLLICGTVAKLAMRQPFVLFKGLTFQKLCLPGAFRPGDHHNKMLRPGLCVVHASPQYL